MIDALTPALALYLITLSIPLLVAFGPVVLLLVYRAISEDLWHHIGISLVMMGPLYVTTMYMIAADLQGKISAYSAPLTMLLPLLAIPVVGGMHCYSIKDLDREEIGLTAFAYLTPLFLFPFFLISLGVVGL